LENLVPGYQEDITAKTLLEELILSDSPVRGFSLSNGVIRYKGRIWIGSNSLAISMFCRLCTVVVWVVIQVSMPLIIESKHCLHGLR
jgi:hypothetical protein